MPHRVISPIAIGQTIPAGEPIYADIVAGVRISETPGAGDGPQVYLSITEDVLEQILADHRANQITTASREDGVPFEFIRIYCPPLDRHHVNKAIQVLRDGRNRAFGRDE